MSICNIKSELNRYILLTLIFFSVSITYAQPGTGTPSRNDHIFPAAAVAKPYINYDARGFLINGKRAFIASAGMEYARVPRGLWKDRLTRLKRAGFNTVEMYTFWNFHEEKEGQFNFTGDHDLNAYLQLVKSMGMYAIVRVGPYYCGEWSMGGYPIWLKFKPGMKVREDNPQFKVAVGKFFDRLMPIVAKNQVHRGGSVIMVQLENEHRASWGTIVPNDYFKFLISKTTALGLQVPYFFSGLHPGNDPASEYDNLDDPDRPNPWFSTEYWGVWITNYGPQPDDSTLYDRRTWKILAHGGNGYNVYMAHGGSNFEFFNDREMAASYDYGAAVGQAGDLRPLYYSFKRANWFAHSFREILANSQNTIDTRVYASDTAIKVNSRKSNHYGSVVFFDNQDSVPHQFTIRTHEDGDLNAVTQAELAPGQIMPCINNYPLTPNIRLTWSPAYVYGMLSHTDRSKTLVIQGKAGNDVELYLRPRTGLQYSVGAGFSKIHNDYVKFKATVSATQPSNYIFNVGEERVRIIVVSNELADRTWFVENGSGTDVVIGPDYAGRATIKNNITSLQTERPWKSATYYPTFIYQPKGEPEVMVDKSHKLKRDSLITLTNWRQKDASQPSQPNFDDSKWKQVKAPLQMGADGDITSNAWYRTKLKANEPGKYLLKFSWIIRRMDTLQHGAIYLDGKRIDTSELFKPTIELDLKANTEHSLAVFMSHIGRNKLIFKVGRIDTLDIKGIVGPVTLQKTDGTGKPKEVVNWRMKGGQGEAYSTDGWKPLSANNANKPTFYRATLNLPAVKGSLTIWRVNTTSLSNGSVWLNGHNIGRYPEKIRIWGHYLPENWLKPGKNEIVIYEENGAQPTKVAVQAETEASRETGMLQYKTKVLQ
ncbi:beta-galactosidase [Mucilaginibacter myungsuensis]|uniref:Beta-galactosidase n=1 Tax=Mucilaginibacter myungsuensis TaxID=649104 RepID=A0A929PXA2_9SPHI|nr:beta-galactosidase [Mucilaginibacter myungsuensis]MBE9663648.1 beta-galactosidase [Mucilaginibacter myungsuensis]MDN3599028.1 beta-galactosidase [Mucilaginibacter myungsuensis]